MLSIGTFLMAYWVLLASFISVANMTAPNAPSPSTLELATLYRSPRRSSDALKVLVRFIYVNKSELVSDWCPKDSATHKMMLGTL